MTVTLQIYDDCHLTNLLNNGYTIAAFKELLNYAKSKNMKYVTAKI